MLRGFSIALAATLAVATAPLAAAPRLTGEQELAKMLAGRVPGKPVSCISTWDSRDMQVLDKTALVYRAGNTIYVNRPHNADHLDSNDILVTRIHGSEFCQLDMVETVDRGGHFTTGFLNLGDFVPYRRAPVPASMPATGPAPKS